MNSSKFATLVTVFFFWGFLAASNGVFIPFCKDHFHLSNFQSQLIDLAFYFAYFLGSLALYLFEQITKIDIFNKIGYKMGIVSGLVLSAVGAIAMIFSINSGVYELILTSFFIIALGFSVQQTCAQPFAIALGDPATGSHRLNLAGGVNSFGTTVGPIIVSAFLFGGVKGGGAVEISSVNHMYMGLAALFLAVAAFFTFSGLPSVSNEEKLEPGAGALKYPQLVLGMIAIFVYVGVEVTIQSNMGALLALPSFGSFKHSDIGPFISLYWGGLMIGRWTGSLSIFNFSKTTNLIMTILVPYIAFGVVLGANYISGKDISHLYVFGYVIPFLIAGFLLGEDKPVKTLMIVSLLGAAFMTVGVFTTGTVATFAFIAGGLFCSVMWPCIFSLAIAGLGKYTAQGSALLIMMILGGALIPPFHGWLGDQIGIHNSYVITIILFAYLAFHAWQTKNVLKKQGIDFDQKAAGGH